MLSTHTNVRIFIRKTHNHFQSAYKSGGTATCCKSEGFSASITHACTLQTIRTTYVHMHVWPNRALTVLWCETIIYVGCCMLNSFMPSSLLCAAHFKKK